MIESGYVAEAEFVVQQRDTAAMLALEPRDRFPEVFATSRMIALDGTGRRACRCTRC